MKKAGARHIGSHPDGIKSQLPVLIVHFTDLKRPRRTRLEYIDLSWIKKLRVKMSVYEKIGRDLQESDGLL